MVAQPHAGMFQSPYEERRGDAIALRLPVSLDAQVRQAAGWQSKADNIALRDWIEGACQQRAEGRGQEAGGYTPEQMRAAINRVALTIQPRDRGKALKLLNALMGELLAERE